MLCSGAHGQLELANKLTIALNIVIIVCFSCRLQLEEANRTLTSDVANLANEKEELNNKLKDAEGGNENV